MWFATQGGLSRYDGKRFKNYKHTPDDSLGLSSNYVNALHTINNGDIWVDAYLCTLLCHCLIAIGFVDKNVSNTGFIAVKSLVTAGLISRYSGSNTSF